LDIPVVDQALPNHSAVIESCSQSAPITYRQAFSNLSEVQMISWRVGKDLRIEMRDRALEIHGAR